MKEAHFFSCVPLLAAAVVCWSVISSWDDYLGPLEPCKQVQFDDSRLIATDGGTAEGGWWSIASLIPFLGRQSGRSVDLNATGTASRDERYDPFTLRVDVRKACRLSRQQTTAKDKLERRPAVPDGYEAVILCVLDERAGSFGHCFHLYLQPTSGSVMFNGTVFTADGIGSGAADGCDEDDEDSVETLAHLLAVCRSCYLQLALTPIQMASWLNDTDTGVKHFLAAATCRRRESPFPDQPHTRPWLRWPSTQYVTFPSASTTGDLTAWVKVPVVTAGQGSAKVEGGARGWMGQLMWWLGILWLLLLTLALGAALLAGFSLVGSTYMGEEAIKVPEAVKVPWGRTYVLKAGMAYGLVVLRMLQYIVLLAFLCSTLIADACYRSTYRLIVWALSGLIVLVIVSLFFHFDVDLVLWRLWLRYEQGTEKGDADGKRRHSLWRDPRMVFAVMLFTALMSLVSILSTQFGIDFVRVCLGISLGLHLLLVFLTEPHGLCCWAFSCCAVVGEPSVRKAALLRLMPQYLCHRLAGMVGGCCYLVKLLVTALGALTVASSAYGLWTMWAEFYNYAVRRTREQRKLGDGRSLPKWVGVLTLMLGHAIVRVIDLAVGFPLLWCGLLRPALLVTVCCDIVMTVAQGPTIHSLNLGYPCSLLFISPPNGMWLLRSTATWLAGDYLKLLSIRMWANRSEIQQRAVGLLSGILPAESATAGQSSQQQPQESSSAADIPEKQQIRKDKKSRTAAVAGQRGQEQTVCPLPSPADVAAGGGPALRQPYRRGLAQAAAVGLTAPSEIQPSLSAHDEGPAGRIMPDEEATNITKAKTRRRKKKRPTAKGGQDKPPGTEQQEALSVESPAGSRPLEDSAPSTRTQTGEAPSVPSLARRLRMQDGWPLEALLGARLIYEEERQGGAGTADGEGGPIGDRMGG
ncbi:unnamed protein product [Vitrella brassicaformis CCMP3155]|uniref:TRP C-terminal domain-containing protein n=1 Tax=Vitrella brassicaformis (strain CCMP3155) TaxID=1169540 RepID=A0A0G4G1Z8_VITBC|nr:unnamed protein product [Vitrella brassicaformis CCMP3155]|eukprot:CEM22087.1 unnamed protein product [Vitrella brassicaformis CCMP3155]